jgi:hypothetical protein
MAMPPILSPQVLIAMTEWADAGLAGLFRSLDPHAPAIFPVAWAGEEASENWMDVARDYTEKWHHTQQLFDATGRASTILGRDLYHPCLDTFMRALPFTLRSVEAGDGTVVAVEVTGEAGGVWSVERRAGGRAGGSRCQCRHGRRPAPSPCPRTRPGGCSRSGGLGQRSWLSSRTSASRATKPSGFTPSTRWR